MTLTLFCAVLLFLCALGARIADHYITNNNCVSAVRAPLSPSPPDPARQAQVKLPPEWCVQTCAQRPPPGRPPATTPRRAVPRGHGHAADTRATGRKVVCARTPEQKLYTKVARSKFAICTCGDARTCGFPYKEREVRRHFKLISL